MRRPVNVTDSSEALFMIGKDYNWYAVYLKTNHERKVEVEMRRCKIETYLPLVKEIRNWSDRKKLIEAPLFPNYLFVKVSVLEYMKVLEQTSVFGFLKNEGHPAKIPDIVIKSIQASIRESIDYRIESGQNLVGKLMLIASGPFKGLTGRLVNDHRGTFLIMEMFENKFSFMLRICRDQLTEVKQD